MEALTPLEKSLLNRLQKAQSLVSLLVEENVDYSHKLENESLEGLTHIISQIQTLNCQCAALRIEFLSLTHQRQDDFILAPNSMKNQIYQVLLEVRSLCGDRSNSFRLFRYTVNKLNVKNSLSAPNDPFKPGAQNEFISYQHSFANLGKQFEVVIETLIQINGEPADISHGIKSLQTKLSELNTLSEHTASCYQTLMDVHNHRVQLHYELKNRVHAMLIRSRHLLGPRHPVYLALFKFIIR